MRVLLLFLSLLFAYGYHLISAWYPEVDWIQTAFMSAVWPAFWAFLCAVIILFVSLDRRIDSLMGSWGAMALTGCMLIIPLIVAREQQANVEVQLRDTVRQARKDLRLQQVRKNEVTRKEIADRQERMKEDRFVQYEGRIPADSLGRLRELDAAMLQDVRSHVDAYQRALDANPTLGPDEWVRFKTIDLLSLEIAKHRDLYEQTRAFAQFVESFEETYTTRIRELDLQPPADRIAIAEMERIIQEWERTRAFDLRRLDVELLGSALNALNILSDEWGRWSYDPRKQNIVFENKDKERQFTENILFIKAILEEVRLINEESRPRPGDRLPPR